MKRTKLEALIELVDDPDKTVFSLVERELLNETSEIIPALEEKWENSFDENSQARIETLIQSLQFKRTKDMLKEWLTMSGPDLLDGFLIADRFQYPDQNLISIRQKIEKLKKSVWLELNDSLTMLEKTTILNHIFFNIYGFSINFNNIHSPQNCFLNQMLDTKKGNFVSLSIYYTILARMLEMPAVFVDYPKNPLVAMVDSKLAKKVHGNDTDSDILFYINVANKGSVTGRKEVEYHLRKHNYVPMHLYSEPRSDREFILRLFESLADSYHSVGFKEKEEKIKELVGLF